VSDELAQIGGPLAVAGLGLLVLARPREVRLLGLALWAAGTILLVPVLAPSGQAGVLAGAAVAGVAIASALAAAFRRWPWVLPLLVLAATPARIPVSIGDTKANLLVPLYVIVVAAALLLAWELLRDEPRARELGLVAWPLVLLVGWLGLSIVWTNDVREAAIELLFFLVPFGLLAVSISRLPWRERGVAGVWQLLFGMALLFALVGIGQWITKDVFWNPKVIVGNDVEPFFRVNSLFWDPSIYGRFLVVAILATLVLLVLGLARRWHAALVCGIAIVWVGLLFSYSQSSFVALMAGVIVLAALAWKGRVLAAVSVAVSALVLMGVSAPAAPIAQGAGARGELVSEGIGIALDHPVLGVGLGGFKSEYAEKLGLRRDRTPAAASHTTPVTVAAEAGFPGLLLLVWLVGAAVWAAFQRPASGAILPRAVSWASGLAVVAIAVHSCFYDAFFEDPMVWGALGLLALGATVRRGAPEPG
jgi:putative inorganic carbon (HCO3(-)) transporter